MAGSILENLSGKKLTILVSIVLACQVICFLVGGLIAPAPNNADNVLATKCAKSENLPPGQFDTQWHIPRGKSNQPINCQIIEDFQDPIIYKQKISANQIVFAFQLPLPRNGYALDYSRWMQNLIGILNMDIAYNEDNPMGLNPELTIEVKMGYRNKWEPEDKWTLLANATEKRKLKCTLKEKHEGHDYDCDLLPLFELGSVHHDYYLFNLRLPTTGPSDKYQINNDIGSVHDVWLMVINQNGGFTKVWVSLKTIFFPIIITSMVWYWKRIKLLSRAPALLEKMLLALGFSISLINLPIEYFTLFIEMPFSILLNDIFQGIFNAFLLSFWLVFCGEHLMDDIERNKLRSYWKNLSCVAIGCFCLFIFDMCERGTQLVNPFYSIWGTDVGTTLALGFIILAGCSAGLYFFFLCYMVYRVLSNIGFKRLTLPGMSAPRRLFYEGIVYRFKFLLAATVICAAMTVISYIIGQVSEGRWKWDDNISIHYTSAFFTGVYGMWNLYVFTLLILYAPSHKFYPPSLTEHLTSTQDEEVEFSRLTHDSVTEPTEISALTSFTSKAALD